MDNTCATPTSVSNAGALVGRRTSNASNCNHPVKIYEFDPEASTLPVQTNVHNEMLVVASKVARPLAKSERSKRDVRSIHRLDLTCRIETVLGFTKKQKPLLWVSTSSNAASRTYHTATALSFLSILVFTFPGLISTTCNWS